MEYKWGVILMIKAKGEEIDTDILSSVEFDLSEAIKDLIWNIKTIKKDVDIIKEHLKL